MRLDASPYRDDLTYIHDAGFGHLATNAAFYVIEELKRTGSHSGTVVDLGCGSGIMARALCDAGFKVAGIDLSESLLTIARTRVPGASFRIGSFATSEIPPCIAVTAIGEVFNYAFDPSNTADVRTKVFDRIYAALRPGGIFIFDIAGPARAPSNSPHRTFIEEADWAVLVETEAEISNVLLTRRITTFRKRGEGYRRDSEVHCLHLIDPQEVVDALHRVGFVVQVIDCYGSLPLPQGLVGVVARRPPS